jgi:hypothetical protein
MLPKKPPELPVIEKANRSAPIPGTATCWSAMGGDQDAFPGRLVTRRLDDRFHETCIMEPMG